MLVYWLFFCYNIFSQWQEYVFRHLSMAPHHMPHYSIPLGVSILSLHRLSNVIIWEFFVMNKMRWTHSFLEFIIKMRETWLTFCFYVNYTKAYIQDKFHICAYWILCLFDARAHLTKIQWMIVSCKFILILFSINNNIYTTMFNCPWAL